MVHPLRDVQQDLGLTDLSDYALQNIALHMDFQTLHCFAKTSHRMRDIAVQAFLERIGNESTTKALELATMNRLPLIIFGIVDVVLKINCEDSPNEIKRIARAMSVDAALRIAVRRRWTLDIYVILHDVELGARVTRGGATFAILDAYNYGYMDCVFAIMSSANAVDRTELCIIVLMLTSAVTKGDMNFMKFLLQNESVFKRIPKTVFIEICRSAGLDSQIKELLEHAIDRKKKVRICAVQ